MKDAKEIFINSTIGSTRIAILNNNMLSDLYIERPDHKKMVGNIYNGKVQNIIPGMQAAFIDIGFHINAFLPFSEIIDKNSINESIFESDNKKFKSNHKKKIDFEIGDNILVQVIKEPFSGKGPRVSTNLSISGNLIVLVPNQKYIGISKKINDKYERTRLKQVIKSIKPDDFGVIVRTITSGKDQNIIQKDFDKLLDEWNNINEKMNTETAPNLVYNDHTITNMVIRDLFTEDINKMYVDDKSLYKKIYSYTKDTNPKQIKNIEYYKNKIPIFDNHAIEEQISKSLKNKSWLKSGAYLIIDHTEAMVVIDVNSGRFIGKGSHEENSLKINIEAAHEIARQLRIRDIGGLVVIDFIDLMKSPNRKKVYEELKKLLKKDRAKVSISEFSEFGLLQMTRQRVGLSLLHTLTDNCKNCNGLGRINSKDSTLTKLENWLKRFKTKFSDKRLIIYVNEQMYDYIKNTKKSAVNKLMFKNWLWITLKIDSSLNNNEYTVFSKKRKKDITNEV